MDADPMILANRNQKHVLIKLLVMYLHEAYLTEDVKIRMIAIGLAYVNNYKYNIIIRTVT